MTSRMFGSFCKSIISRSNPNAIPPVQARRLFPEFGTRTLDKVAFSWAEKAEEKFDMACTYEEGKAEDLVSFTRSGVTGTLNVSKDNFELNAKLGFLLGAFKERIAWAHEDYESVGWATLEVSRDAQGNLILRTPQGTLAIPAAEVFF